jgi:flagellar L-ring protein precursor FlgH
MKMIDRRVIGLVLTACMMPALADSLYDPQAFRSMVADKRAHKVGDNITVLIYENSSATTRADASTRRSTQASLRAGLDEHQHSADIGLGSDFDGGGTIQRSGKLLAQITVSVTDIARNGDLWISGEQQLEINTDKQHIRVQGRVRPLDINEANSVLSNRLADARISYLGKGDLADSQKRGWLSKAFTWLGL